MVRLPSAQALLALALVSCLLAGFAPAASGAAGPASSQSSPAVAPAPARFDVFELRVLGNTRLGERDIDATLYPFLGPARTLDDVEAARAALEALYHAHGFGTVFVDIPEQTVEAGLVRLHVTEGTLDRVAVTGARYFSGREIRAVVSEARPGTTPDLPALQAQVNALNLATRDRQVTPVLKAGAQPGTVDLTLKVEDHLPLHASLELNNQYTLSTEPLRAIAGISYDNLFGRLDSVSLQYQTSPQDTGQVKVWTGSYTTHVFDGDARLSLYYFRSNSSVATLGTGDASLTVLGKGSVSGARLVLPLPASDKAVQAFTLGAEYKDFLEDINATGGGTGLRTPISYLNFSGAYSGGWRSETLQGTFNTAANFGVRGIQNSPSEFENKRFLAPPNYFYLRSGATLDWQFSKLLRLHLALAGQYATDPIISNEQFSISGVDGVRGYYEAEVLGDRGYKLSTQLGTPQWTLANGKVALSGYAFQDFGHAGFLRPLPGEPAGADLASIGIGIDLAFFRHLSGALTWAEPLRDATTTRKKASRLLFSAKANW